jgi:hypothetical protein
MIFSENFDANGNLVALILFFTFLVIVFMQSVSELSKAFVLVSFIIERLPLRKKPSLASCK